MADVKITDLPEVKEVADDDQVLLIDVSDNTAGPNGTDKRSVLARLADLLFKYDVETAAELEASNPIITGRRAICRERADANYILAPEGYNAVLGDIVAANDRVWMMVIGSSLTSSMLGLSSLTFYCSTSGSSSVNLGTLTNPSDKPSTIINYIQSLGVTIREDVKIVLLDGVYSDSVLILGDTLTEGVLTIEGSDVGGSPNTPVAIFDGGGSLQDAITISRQNRVKLNNIKIQNYLSDGVRGEFSVIDKINIHVDNCSKGFYYTNRVSYSLQGGVLSNCEWGIQELFNIVRNTKTVNNVADGLHITSCTRGVHAKELCTGHLDFTTITDCDMGVVLSRSSTANGSDCVIKRNRVGVYLMNNSSFVPLRVDWGMNGVDENTEANWIFSENSGFTVEGTGEITAPPINENVLGMKDKQSGYFLGTSSHTGDTLETKLCSVGKHKAGGLVREGQYLKVVVSGQKSGNAGAASLRLELGNINYVNVNIPADASRFEIVFEIVSTGMGSQKCFASAKYFGSSQQADAFNVSRSNNLNNLTADMDVNVKTALSDASDTMIVERAQAYTNY